VKALVSTGDAVLLVKESHDDGSAFWTLPGGGLHASESPVEGLRRELREELDCEVVVDGQTDRVWYAHHSRAGTLSSYDVYDCAVASSVDPNPAEGTLAARWVPTDELPPRTLPQVRTLLERHPEVRT
jgi:ADP-ribose pyrophosphatase YjhB (NUDIX family)